MLDKFEIARSLREIGILLEFKGENPYKVRAYESGASSLEASGEDVGKLVDEGRLTSIRGIGDALAAKIAELYLTGRSSLLERLRKELPPGVIELSQVPGLSTKKIQALHDALGISNIGELKRALEEKRVRNVSGFGIKTEQKILEGIHKYETQEHRMILMDALDLCEKLLSHIRERPAVKRAEVAGSVRRWQETAGNINLVVMGDSLEKCGEGLARFPLTVEIEARDENLIACRLANGMKVLMCVVPQANFIPALFTHTGSASHVERMRELARQRGFELSHLHLKKKGAVVKLSSEEELYAALKLPYIPPELREEGDEVDQALAGDDFKDLIEEDDIQGMTHCHSTFSDGRHSIEMMAQAAKEMGKKYITMTDHSPAAHYAGGLSQQTLIAQWKEIEAAKQKLGIMVFKGTESDILENGDLDYPEDVLDKLEVVIASIHSRMQMEEAQMTKRIINCMKLPHFKIWGHPLARLLLRRDPVACRMDEILDVIAKSPAAIEVNGDPHRMDMEPRHLKKARQRGIKFVISTDAHSIRDLQFLPYGVHLARRGGLRRSDVLNTLGAEEFARRVRPSA